MSGILDKEIQPVNIKSKLFTFFRFQFSKFEISSKERQLLNIDSILVALLVLHFEFFE